MSDEYKNLDLEESGDLNKKGWFLVTYFQCRKDTKACKSRDRAIEKAESLERNAGIRTIEKEEYVVFEVWEKW